MYCLGSLKQQDGEFQPSLTNSARAHLQAWGDRVGGGPWIPSWPPHTSGMWLSAEHLSSIPEALGSFPSTTKTLRNMYMYIP